MLAATAAPAKAADHLGGGVKVSPSPASAASVAPVFEQCPRTTRPCGSGGGTQDASPGHRLHLARQRRPRRWRRRRRKHGTSRVGGIGGARVRAVRVRATRPKRRRCVRAGSVAAFHRHMARQRRPRQQWRRRRVLRRHLPASAASVAPVFEQCAFESNGLKRVAVRLCRTSLRFTGCIAATPPGQQWRRRRLYGPSASAASVAPVFSRRSRATRPQAAAAVRTCRRRRRASPATGAATPAAIAMAAACM